MAAFSPRLPGVSSSSKESLIALMEPSFISTASSKAQDTQRQNSRGTAQRGVWTCMSSTHSSSVSVNTPARTNTHSHTHAYCSLAQRAVLAWKAGPSYQNMIYHNKVIFNSMTRERTLLTLAHCFPAQNLIHCSIPST